jgi:hypothetical protein
MNIIRKILFYIHKLRSEHLAQSQQFLAGATATAASAATTAITDDAVAETAVAAPAINAVASAATAADAQQRKLRHQHRY